MPSDSMARTNSRPMSASKTWSETTAFPIRTGGPSGTAAMVTPTKRKDSSGARVWRKRLPKRGHEVFLEDHLDGVRDRLEKPEHPQPQDLGPVGPDPVLDDGALLALDPGQVQGEDEEPDQEDDHLDQDDEELAHRTPSAATNPSSPRRPRSDRIRQLAADVETGCLDGRERLLPSALAEEAPRFLEDRGRGEDEIHERLEPRRLGRDQDLERDGGQEGLLLPQSRRPGRVRGQDDGQSGAPQGLLEPGRAVEAEPVRPPLVGRAVRPEQQPFGLPVRRIEEGEAAPRRASPGRAGRRATDPRSSGASSAGPPADPRPRLPPRPRMRFGQKSDGLLPGHGVRAAPFRRSRAPESRVDGPCPASRIGRGRRSNTR